MDTFQAELQLIFQYFPNLSPLQIQQFTQMQEIYVYWNERINLISRKDIHHLYLHHVLHSLSISKVLHFLPNTKVLDIGTGGGFPGIPLAIIFPETKFYLNDSIQKKIMVVNEVKKLLNLNNVITIHNRAEKIKEKFDFVASRAVSSFPEFLKLVNRKISTNHQHTLPNGILYLKGGSIEALQKELGRYYNEALIFNIQNYISHSYFENKHIIHYAIIE